jgi:hypothetical protein
MQNKTQILAPLKQCKDPGADTNPPKSRSEQIWINGDPDPRAQIRPHGWDILACKIKLVSFFLTKNFII